MKQVYVKRNGDEEIIQKYILNLERKSDQELVDAYNREKRIYGVHRQLLYLIALDSVFTERFGKSPIINEDHIILGLSRKIVYIATLKTFEFLNDN